MSTALHRARPTASEPVNPAGAEDESDISALIARLTAEVNQVACEKTKSIQQITNQMKMLALNALIESFARRRARRGLCGGGAGSARRRPAGRNDRARAGKPADQADRQSR